MIATVCTKEDGERKRKSVSERRPLNGPSFALVRTFAGHPKIYISSIEVIVQRRRPTATLEHLKFVSQACNTHSLSGLSGERVISYFIFFDYPAELAKFKSYTEYINFFIKIVLFQLKRRKQKIIFVEFRKIPQSSLKHCAVQSW